MIFRKSILINGSKDKKILLDIFFEKNNSKKNVVLFSHGFKGFKDWGPFNQMAEFFANNNFFFIKFNFSYNGTSIDNPVEFVDLNAFGNNNFSLELDDLNLVIDWIFNNKYNNEINTDNINLLGHSRGGAISILKASEDKRVNKVVSLASPSNFMKRMDEIDKGRNECMQ